MSNERAILAMERLRELGPRKLIKIQKRTLSLASIAGEETGFCERVTACSAPAPCSAALFETLLSVDTTIASRSVMSRAGQRSRFFISG
jgi:hypothetical protein